MPQWPRIHPASWAGVAWLAARLVTAYLVWVDHFLPLSGRRRRMTWMARAACGNASPRATAVTFRVRRSARPWPFSRMSQPAGISRQGRLLS